MYLIGLTGNIGSGKSTVRQMLEQLGARTIDADALAHAVLLRGTPAWRLVVETFGTSILRADGEVDRRKLGAVVFADQAELRKLESIVHPAVSTQLGLLLREAREPVVVVEAVKLIEAGLHLYCDAVWIVKAPVPESKRRLMQDRAMSEIDAEQRLRAQPPLEQKLRLATVVIDNGGSLEGTRAQVTAAFAAIQPELGGDKTPVLISLLGLAPQTPLISGSGAAASRASPPPSGRGGGSALPAESPGESILPMLDANVESVSVRPARPVDLGLLARLLADLEGAGAPLARQEVLRRFGKWGYWLAEADGQAVGLAGWHAENLVALVHDLWTISPKLAPRVFPMLLVAVEQEAQRLQCEVVALITNAMNDSTVRSAATGMGYRASSSDELHPLWRSVMLSELTEGESLYIKRLRLEIVTKPI